MQKRCIFSIVIVFLLLALTGGFVFAGGEKEKAQKKEEAGSAKAEPVEEEVEGTDTAEALLDALPPELKAYYANTTDPINPSAYDDFEPVETPWKIGYADSYQGNPWRVAVRDELIRLANEFKAAGKVEVFENAVSGNDVSQQISNIRAYIDKGVDVIISIPESSTGLNEVIEEAYNAGIPFITMAGPVTSPYAINVSSNYYKWGYDMLEGIGERLNGKGNVLMVEGIAGHPIVLAEAAGFDDALKEYPSLNVVARVNGDWTLSVTKQAVLQVLATHPEPIDAVWTTGSESRVIAEAFKEAGRPTPLITGSLTGDIMGYWKKHGDEGFKFYGHGVLPHWTAQTGFRIAMRILEGQHPKLNLLMIPLPEVVQEDLPKWYADCMDTDTTSIFPIPPEDPFPEDAMDKYFWNGEPTPPYDYDNVPGPCE